MDERKERCTRVFPLQKLSDTVVESVYSDEIFLADCPPPCSRYTGWLVSTPLIFERARNRLLPIISSPPMSIQYLSLPSIARLLYYYTDPRPVRLSQNKLFSRYTHDFNNNYSFSFLQTRTIAFRSDNIFGESDRVDLQETVNCEERRGWHDPRRWRGT